MHPQREIEYLHSYLQGVSMSIEPDVRHNIYFSLIEPYLTDNVFTEPKNYPYTLTHKNSNRPLTIKKMNVSLDKRYQETFERLSKSDFIRFRKTIDGFGEELTQIRYKFTESADVIEQLPMIKLWMIAHMSIDYLEYRIRGDRIEFRFWFLDQKIESYSKEVIVSIDHSILADKLNNPLIIKADNELNTNTTMIFQLLIKALLLITNVLDIDLHKANINSYIAAIRGGKLYRLEPNSQFNLDNLDNLDNLNNLDNRDNPGVLIKVTENNKKPTTLSKKITNLAEQNRKMNKSIKKISVPRSLASVMIKNLFESDVLLGITSGNTFLYTIDSLEVLDKGELQVKYMNPMRGNTITVDSYTILSNLKRIGVILDRHVLEQINSL